MERELWPALYQLLQQVGRDVHQKYTALPSNRLTSL